MMSSSSPSPFSRGFFLFSFLPALAYWYLEAYYPVRVAVTGGVILAVLEISLEKWFSGKVHSLSKFNFFLVAFLGIISLLAAKGVWFKLQPAFTGFGVATFLVYRLRQEKSILVEMLEEMPGGKDKLKLIPPAIWILMERDLAGFFALYASFMAVVALWMSTSVWLFGKTAGFYIASFLFMAGEFMLMRFRMKRIVHERQTQILALDRFRPQN